MGRLRQKGKAGAAKAYVTRTSAIKKLQCSLADFRRLCILKGIFPREPRSRKRANKGSSAPTSFYYAKDIAYLAHEPVLKKLREHKAFAKKLSRALGRGEWSDAKNLEDNKPVYRLDHIIKERYPTFIDAVRDIDDALCMVFLFASLPSNARLPPSLIENCSRLAAEWQLYVMHTRSLRKTFLSIKGIYYQAEVMDQTVTWLVPYQFTQNIPADVDVRVMLTFLELYQTLLGFVFFKLYTDSGLVYPPPLDAKKDEGGAGVGAFSLQSASQTAPSVTPKAKTVEVDGRKISGKDVRQVIKTMTSADSETNGGDIDMQTAESNRMEVDEEFVPQQSTSDPQSAASLTTLKALAALPQSLTTSLFSPYTFYLSRESSRPIFEFIVRSFGGRIGWPASSGSGSPFEESDDSITHVIIDRPLVERTDETTEERERRSRRKYVQPQWVVDCINAGKILLEEPYAQGKTLPPHLSPFGEYEGAYDPTAGLANQAAEESESEEEDVILPEEEEDDEEQVAEKSALRAAAAANDAAALRAAELAAEVAGVDYGTFEKEVRKSRKKSKATASGTVEDGEQDMNKMMMSNKQKKLYERMKYSEKKKASERAALEGKRQEIQKQKKREAKTG
ncbi:Pescadillo N-terminus-domain-containing protein [Mycena capillaripes]|nr:Pescadillo N-terminus-domain-containing protein [Mycena capillaripes]